MKAIEDFTNDKFEVLDYMVSIRKNDNGVYATQQEITDALYLSRVCVNQTIGELKSKEYVKQDPKHRGSGTKLTNYSW